MGARNRDLRNTDIRDVGENLAKPRAVTHESDSAIRPVAEAVVAGLVLGVQPEELRPRISTGVPVETSEIRVTARDRPRKRPRNL